MDDESDKISRLEDRIEQLEATTKKMMPTRRDALKFGGAAAIGAAAMSGTASAGSSQVGTIGDASNLVDVEAEDINVSDTINGASVAGAAAGEALTSDGSGGLTFASAGGGVVLESGDTITVESIALDSTDESFVTLYNGSAKDVLGGIINQGFRFSDWLYTFSDGSTLRKNGSGISYTFGFDNRGNHRGTAGGDVDFMPPAKDVTKIEVGADTFDNSSFGAEVILKD